MMPTSTRAAGASVLGVERLVQSCLESAEFGAHEVTLGLGGGQQQSHLSSAYRSGEIATALVAGDEIVEHAPRDFVGMPGPDGKL